MGEGGENGPASPTKSGRTPAVLRKTLQNMTTRGRLSRLPRCRRTLRIRDPLYGADDASGFSGVLSPRFCDCERRRLAQRIAGDPPGSRRLMHPRPDAEQAGDDLKVIPIPPDPAEWVDRRTAAGDQVAPGLVTRISKIRVPWTMSLGESRVSCMTGRLDFSLWCQSRRRNGSCCRTGHAGTSRPEQGPDDFRGCSIRVLSFELAVVIEPLSGQPAPESRSQRASSSKK